MYMIAKNTGTPGKVGKSGIPRHFLKMEGGYGYPRETSLDEKP